MSERETKELLCPSGCFVKIKTYLTPRETREIEHAPLRHAKIGIDKSPDEKGNLKDKPALREYDVAAGVVAAENELIIQGVVEFNGSAERILDRILDGRMEDYRFIISELNEMSANPAEPK